MFNRISRTLIPIRVATKSGLSIPVVSVERGSGEELAAREHPAIVRATHWLNVVSLVVMTMSGLEIFAAFPSFGPKLPQSDPMQIPAAIRLGGWLGGALQWHYTFAWLFALTGGLYVWYLGLSGHWRHVILQWRELNGLWPMARHYLLLKEKPTPLEAYNALQKLAYTSTIAFGILAAVTGIMLSKPVQLSGVVERLGGFALVRLYHFAAMVGLLAFVAGHLLMVALHGWANFASMWTGWKRRPEYLRDSTIGLSILTRDDR
jgi:thiosulfate reductase cytochrome b subunit